MAYKVPEFGKWKHGEKVTYTASFENARKLRNSWQMMNSNNLHELTDSVPENKASIQHSTPPVKRSELKGKQSKVTEHKILESQNKEGYTDPDKSQTKKNSSFSAKALLDRNYKVPEFGKWQTGEKITYTASFENARKVRNTWALMDPNNFHELTNRFPNNEASGLPPLPPPVGRSGRQAQQSKVTEYCVAGAQNEGSTTFSGKAQKDKNRACSTQTLHDRNLQPKVSKFVGPCEGEEFHFERIGKANNTGSMLNSNDQHNSAVSPRFGGRSIQDPSTHHQVDRRGHRSYVPQFGAWEKGDNVGYTVLFENARKGGSTGRKNEPKLNQDMHDPNKPPAQAHSDKAKPKPQTAAQPTQRIQFGSWESGGEVAYTAYFKNVRKNNKKGSETILQPSEAPEEACSKMPQFGAWDGGESVAYTAYFDNARKIKNVGSGPHPFESQLNHNVSDRTQSRTAATKAVVKERGKQTLGGQSPLHQREEKLHYRPDAHRGYPTSKVSKSGASEDAEIFRVYCDVIERGWPPAEQLSRGRGNRSRFEPRRSKD